MICHKCGQANQEQATVCSRCGAALSDSAISGSVQPPAAQRMSFGRAMITCLSKYIDFNGRATRAEYWWFTLFTVVVLTGTFFIDATGMLADYVTVPLLLPTLVVTARRLHDGNRSGWLQLIALTVVGIIPLLIWLSRKGDRSRNHYGAPV